MQGSRKEVITRCELSMVMFVRLRALLRSRTVGLPVSVLCIVAVLGCQWREKTATCVENRELELSCVYLRRNCGRLGTIIKHTK